MRFPRKLYCLERSYCDPLAVLDAPIEGECRPRSAVGSLDFIEYWSAQVVLLPAVVAMVNQVRQSSRGAQAEGRGLLAASQLALLIQKSHQVADHFSAWHAWALVALYLWVAACAPGYLDR